MAKFGHTFIAGLLWIIIAIGIGFLGIWLQKFGGIRSVFGWILQICGFLFASMSFLHLWKITSYQIRGMRMMQQDPERFAELKRSYEEAMKRSEKTC